MLTRYADALCQDYITASRAHGITRCHVVDALLMSILLDAILFSLTPLLMRHAAYYFDATRRPDIDAQLLICTPFD